MSGGRLGAPRALWALALLVHAVGSTGPIMPCASGHFSDGKKGCVPCPGGKFQPARGMPACLFCAAGLASVPGARLCTSCMPGRFGKRRGQPYPCMSCRSGRFAPYSGAMSCAVCREGTHSLPGADKCSMCEIGTYSQKEALRCMPCIVGRYNKHAGRPCLKCPSGQFSNAEGSMSCIACPAGQAPGVMRERCVKCTAGHYAAIGATARCLPCVGGRYAVRQGATHCLSCARGKFAPGPGASVCRWCDKGSWSLQTSNKCTLCSAGTYSGALGATRCAECPKGRLAAQAGAHTCDMCLPGTYNANRGHIYCDKCPFGKHATYPGATACEACAKGHFAVKVAGMPKCLACPPGQFTSELGRPLCSKCIQGMYARARGSTRCTDCHKGRTTTNVASTRCDLKTKAEATPPPTPSPDLSCPAGFYRRDRSGSTPFCAPCAAGMFSVGGKNVHCTKCKAGRYSQIGFASCNNCPHGRFGVGGSTGEACDGTCAPGRWGRAGSRSSMCTAPCAAGRYGASAGMSHIYCSGVCPSGKFSHAGSASCTTCPDGKSSGPKSSTCKHPPHSTRAPISSAAAKTVAAANAHKAPGVKSISSSGWKWTHGAAHKNGVVSSTPKPHVAQERAPLCEAGTEAVTRGFVKTCHQCPPGKYTLGDKAGGSSARGRCTACPAGRYGLGGSTSNSCTSACPAGRYGVGGCTSSDCSGACKAGRFGTSGGTTDTCSGLCSAGRYGSTGSSKATCDGACPTGRFSAAGSSVCTACPKGTAQSVAGVAHCSHCGAGRAQPLEGQEVCFTCPPGQHSEMPEGSTECVDGVVPTGSSASAAFTPGKASVPLVLLVDGMAPQELASALQRALFCAGVTMALGASAVSVRFASVQEAALGFDTYPSLAEAAALNMEHGNPGNALGQIKPVGVHPSQVRSQVIVLVKVDVTPQRRHAVVTRIHADSFRRAVAYALVRGGIRLSHQIAVRAVQVVTENGASADAPVQLIPTMIGASADAPVQLTPTMMYAVGHPGGQPGTASANELIPAPVSTFDDSKFPSGEEGGPNSNAATATQTLAVFGAIATLLLAALAVLIKRKDSAAPSRNPRGERGSTEEVQRLSSSSSSRRSSSSSSSSSRSHERDRHRDRERDRARRDHDRSRGRDKDRRKAHSAKVDPRFGGISVNVHIPPAGGPRKARPSPAARDMPDAVAQSANRWGDRDKSARRRTSADAMPVV